MTHDFSHARALDHTLDADQQLPLNERTLDVVREFESPYGDRMTPLTEFRAKHQVPAGTILLDAPERDGSKVVVHCPVTGTPMTQKMADFVHLESHELQAMADRRAPLGLSAAQWDNAQAVLFHALHKAGLTRGEVIVKAGGSSVAGFSSKATALNKKQYPMSEEALKNMVLDNANKQRHSLERSQRDFRRAYQQWSSFSTGERPLAPWYGVMHEFGFEAEPDVDIQIWSEVIDDRVASHSELGELSYSEVKGDRWGRYFSSTVFDKDIAPELGRVSRKLGRLGIKVDLEFLAKSSGRDKIISRTDWWDIS